MVYAIVEQTLGKRAYKKFVKGEKLKPFDYRSFLKKKGFRRAICDYVSFITDYNTYFIVDIYNNIEDIPSGIKSEYFGLGKNYKEYSKNKCGFLIVKIPENIYHFPHDKKSFQKMSFFKDEEEIRNSSTLSDMWNSEGDDIQGVLPYILSDWVIDNV